MTARVRSMVLWSPESDLLASYGRVTWHQKRAGDAVIRKGGEVLRRAALVRTTSAT